MPALDGIRACAVLAVMAYHFLHWGAPAPAPGTFDLVLWKLSQGGWMGVNLFFVLSGFLITGLLLDRQNEPRYYRNFYVRRACRILPAYAFTLLILLLTVPGSAAYVGLSSVFLSNFADLLGVAIVYSSLWSLCVEEHFYLAWPWVTRRYSLRAIEKFCWAVVVVSPLLRAARVYLGWSEGFYTWFWLDSLAWGALLALVSRRVPLERLKRTAVILGGVSLVAALLLVKPGLLSRKSLIGTALGPSFIGFWSGLWIFWVVAFPRGLAARALTAKPLIWIGTLSYGMYLYHSFFLPLTVWAVGKISLVVTPLSSTNASLIRLFIGGSCTLLAAALSYRFLETPFLQLKERLTSK